MSGRDERGKMSAYHIRCSISHFFFKFNGYLFLFFRSIYIIIFIGSGGGLILIDR